MMLTISFEHAFLLSAAQRIVVAVVVVAVVLVAVVVASTGLLAVVVVAGVAAAALPAAVRWGHRWARSQCAGRSDRCTDGCARRPAECRRRPGGESVNRRKK